MEFRTYLGTIIANTVKKYESMLELKMYAVFANITATLINNTAANIVPQNLLLRISLRFATI